jgi:hypothetical protein
MAQSSRFACQRHDPHCAEAAHPSAVILSTFSLAINMQKMQTVFHSRYGGFGRVLEEKNNPRESGLPKQAPDDLLKAREHSVEVTGLGVIAALLVATWPLVSNGTLRLSDYLVFVAFLLVSAGGLVWVRPQLPIQCFAPVLGDKLYVIFALPYRVA